MFKDELLSVFYTFCVTKCNKTLESTSHVDLHLSTIKPLHAKKIIKVYQHFTNKVSNECLCLNQQTFVIPSPSTNNAKHNVLLNFNELVHKMRLLITDTLITDTINEEVILTHYWYTNYWYYNEEVMLTP